MQKNLTNPDYETIYFNDPCSLCHAQFTHMIDYNEKFSDDEVNELIHQLKTRNQQLQEERNRLYYELSEQKTECQALNDKVLSCRIMTDKHFMVIMYLLHLINAQSEEISDLKNTVDMNISNIRDLMEKLNNS